MPEENIKKPKQKFSFSVDYRIVVLILLAIIAGMLAAWKPWAKNNLDDSRTITVTGEALIKAEPDEFVFYPRYEFISNDKGKAADQATNKAEEVIAKLKELGVPDNKLKSNVDGFGGVGFGRDTNGEQYTYSATITITLSDRTLVQKIQDYLLTTTPQGAITPQASFSQAKRNELESKGRDEATKDARKKADQSAKNLGFKITKVKSVKDALGFDGGVITLDSAAGTRSLSAEAGHATAAGGLSIQPGEQEVPYNVEVTYYFN